MKVDIGPRVFSCTDNKLGEKWQSAYSLLSLFDKQSTIGLSQIISVKFSPSGLKYPAQSPSFFIEIFGQKL